MNNIYHVKFDELLDERVSFSDVSNFEVTDTEIECSELEKKDELL